MAWNAGRKAVRTKILMKKTFPMILPQNDQRVMGIILRYVCGAPWTSLPRPPAWPIFQSSEFRNPFVIWVWVPPPPSELHSSGKKNRYPPPLFRTRKKTLGVKNQPLQRDFFSGHLLYSPLVPSHPSPIQA